MGKFEISINFINWSKLSTIEQKSFSSKTASKNNSNSSSVGESWGMATTVLGSINTKISSSKMLYEFLEVDDTRGKIDFSDQNLIAYLNNLNSSFENRRKVSNNLIPFERLGEGTFGSVVKVFDVENKAFYAEKTIKKRNHFKRDVLNEVLSAFHVHLVDREELLLIYKLVYIPNDSLRIIMECGMGSLDELFQFIRTHKIIYGTFLNDIYAQIMSQLDLLQENCICHRDLKPSNIIITKGMRYKFADFGLSEKLNKIGVQEMSYRGTVDYMVPEMVEASCTGSCMIDPFKADLYAAEKIMTKASNLMEEKFQVIDKAEFERRFKDEMTFKVYKKIEEEQAKERIIQLLKEHQMFHDVKVKLERELNELEHLVKDKSLLMKRKVKILDHLGEIFYIQADLLKAWECYFESHQHKVSIFPEVSHEVAHSHDHLGKLLQKEGTYEDALESFKKGLDIKKKLYGDDHSIVAMSYNNIGGIYYDQKEYDLAKEYYIKSLKCSQAEIENVINRSITESNLGLVCFKMKQYQDSINHHTNAIQLLVEYFQTDRHFELAFPYNNLGLALSGSLDHKEAIKYHTLALEIYLETFQEAHPEIALTYQYLATASNDAALFKDSITYYKQCIEMYIKLNGESNSYISSRYNDLGLVYISIEDYRSALIYHKKSLEISLELHEDDPKDLYASHLNIATDCFHCDDMIEAIENYQECIKYHSKFMESNVELEPLYTRIGYCYYISKSYDDALEYFMKSYDILNQEDHRYEESLSECRKWIGAVFEAKGDINKAMKYYRRSTEGKINQNGEVHVESAKSLLHLGSKNQDQENFTEAIDCFRRAHKIYDKLNLFNEEYENIKNKILSCYEQIKEKQICIGCLVKIESKPMKLDCEHALHEDCLSRKYRKLNSCQACEELEQLFSTQAVVKT